MRFIMSSSYDGLDSTGGTASTGHASTDTALDNLMSVASYGEAFGSTVSLHYGDSWFADVWCVLVRNMSGPLGKKSAHAPSFEEPDGGYRWNPT